MSAKAKAARLADDDGHRLFGVLRATSHSLTTRHHGQLVPSGEGLFPLTSAIEHVCAPSAASHWAGDSTKHLETRALRQIRKGERVTASRIDLSAGAVGEQRRAHLLRACAPHRRQTLPPSKSLPPPPPI